MTRQDSNELRRSKLLIRYALSDIELRQFDVGYKLSRWEPSFPAFAPKQSGCGSFTFAPKNGQSQQ
jgi:hypothetical protein